MRIVHRGSSKRYETKLIHEMRLTGSRCTTALKRCLDRLGLRSPLKSLYWGLGVPRLLYRLSSRDSVAHEIGDHLIEFPVETYWQYQRFRWMHPEVELFAEWANELRADDVVWDVGAHLGWHAVVAASVAPGVTVEAFEPHPIAAERLREVAAETDHDIAVHEVALGDQNDTVAFSSDPSPAARVAGSQDDPIDSTIDVKRASGDSLIAAGTVAPPTVIKIDAEGADAAVLRGVRETIETHRPRLVYCEIHVDGAEIRSLLSSYGYEYEPLPSTRPVLRAVPTS